MQQKMKRMILSVVLLVSVVNSKYVDYCQIEPKACDYHIFVRPHEPTDSFDCRAEELEYNKDEKSLKPTGRKMRLYSMKINNNKIKCYLNGIQSAILILEDRTGYTLETTLVFPTLCFDGCGDNFKCNLTDSFRYEEIRMNGLKVRRTYGGCLVDSMCYPHYVVNPANFSQWCFDPKDEDIHKWTDTAYTEDTRQASSSVDMCYLIKNDTLHGRGSIKRASVPEEAGTEGIDLTADGASYDVRSYYRFPIETNFKIYVKFNPEPITENETFLEIPSMLKMQRTPDDAIVVEYTFLDAEANQVDKVVPLMALSTAEQEDGWIQLIGIKMKVNLNRQKRQEAVKFGKDAWTMIGFHYNLYGGVPFLKWYLNGKEVISDHGNTTGLYLRTDRGPILSHGKFSCFEYGAWGSNNANEDFFTNPSLAMCMEQYKKDTENVDPEEHYSECERKFNNWNLD